ncbi:MAG: gamma-glutamyltransferase [Verrucomicrobia bacterium]|nr:gamma-glutamyltransferase [Verrucomicrobiota bacterium]
MSTHINRRTMLRRTAGAFAFGVFAPRIASSAPRPGSSIGYVAGEPLVEDIGAKILADGGNAFDALVATALAGAIRQPHQTGVGGFAAHAMIAHDGGRRITSLDANTTAPAAMRDDIFKPGADGKVPGRKNEFGWLATGVPGLIAGLHLVVQKFGSRPFSAALQPSIKLLRDGFPIAANAATAIKGAAAQMENDPGSRKIYFPDGKPLAAGATYRNPELAELLETLAQANSVEPFYRGDIAQRIAEAFQKNGGLVTTKDLAAHRPRLVEPLALKWGDRTIHTVPLTCGGLTTLQMLAILKAMGWEKMPAGLTRTHAQLEAMRLAWRDRLTLLGDPEFVKVPQAKLLSEDYARECAEKIQATVKAGKILTHAISPQDHGGTLSFSAVDKSGNFIALTLTHGNGFGARVAVPGLGLTLGHGMSRFDPHPAHPNAPGPGKKPLHNMVPALITRGGRPVIAVGGRGGRKIPNSIFEFLTQSVVLGKSLDAAMDAPRVHTEGNATLEFQKEWPVGETEALKEFGYAVKTGTAATLSAVAIEDGVMRAAMR